jgi:hypothetical protein
VRLGTACQPALGTAQVRLHARGDLARAVRLADVVVGADLQPERAVDLVDAAAHHDDRHRGEAAQLVADLQPVEARQGDVQQHQRRLGAPHLGLDVQPVHHDRGGVALRLEEAGKQGGAMRVVIDDEESSGHGGGRARALGGVRSSDCGEASTMHEARTWRASQV